MSAAIDAKQAAHIHRRTSTTYNGQGSILSLGQASPGLQWPRDPALVTPLVVVGKTPKRRGEVLLADPDMVEKQGSGLLLQRMPIRMPAKRHRVPNAWMGLVIGGDIDIDHDGWDFLATQSDRTVLVGWSWRDD